MIEDKGIIGKFVYRLWYAERETLSVGAEPLHVDWPAGNLSMKFEGRRAIMASLWLSNGKILGVECSHNYSLSINSPVEAPVMGIEFHDHDDGPLLGEVRVNDLSIICGKAMVPIKAFSHSSWNSSYTPRWRVLLRGLRDSLRWGCAPRKS